MTYVLDPTEQVELIELIKKFFDLPVGIIPSANGSTQHDSLDECEGCRVRNLRQVANLGNNAYAEAYDTLLISRYTDHHPKGFTWKVEFDDQYTDDGPKYYLNRDGNLLLGTWEGNAIPLEQSGVSNLIQTLNNAFVITKAGVHI